MAQSYPSMRFAADGRTTIVLSKEDEENYGPEWKDTPAAFGVETSPTTCPITKRVIPDPEIAKNAPAPDKKSKKSE
jgi:hypothetical protein